MQNPPPEYQRFEQQGDSGLWVQAPSLERLFIHTALALTDQLVKIDTVAEASRIPVVLEGKDRDELMVRWLHQIILHFEEQKFLSRRIIFNQFDGLKLSAILFGESYVPVRHGGAHPISSLTYHTVELIEGSGSQYSFSTKIYLSH